MNVTKCVSMGVLIASLAACTWVKTTPEGERVGVSTAEAVADCENLGSVNVSLKHNVGRWERKPEKVRVELETLARNEGAIMGGDTVVPEGRPLEGRQKFSVHQCGPAA